MKFIGVKGFQSKKIFIPELKRVPLHHLFWIVSKLVSEIKTFVILLFINEENKASKFQFSLSILSPYFLPLWFLWRLVLSTARRHIFHLEQLQSFHAWRWLSVLYHPVSDSAATSAAFSFHQVVFEFLKMSLLTSSLFILLFLRVLFLRTRTFSSLAVIP